MISHSKLRKEACLEEQHEGTDFYTGELHGLFSSSTVVQVSKFIFG
jgi:hypothetical protein